MRAICWVRGHRDAPVKDDEAHLQDRRMLTPYFGGAALMAYEAGMACKTRELMHTWPLGEAWGWFLCR